MVSRSLLRLSLALFAVSALLAPGAFAQSDEVILTVCTVDAATDTPLEQTFVLARYQTQPSATAFTDGTGCARLAVPTRIGTGSEDEAAILHGFSIDIPFPHPVASRTVLPFRLDAPQAIRFALYDLLGRTAMPEIDATLPAGNHEIALDLTGLQAGLYLYRFTGERGVASGQLVKIGGGTGMPASARLQGGSAPLAPGSASPSARGVQNIIGVRIEAQRDGYLTVVDEREINDGDRVDLPLTSIASGIPPAPILTAPVDGAADASAATLALVWETVAEASSYTVQLSKAADFSSVDQQVEGIATPAFTLTELDLDATYYWRVRATTDGVTGNWSATFHFTTEADLAPVATPVLVTPSNGSIDLPTSAVGLSWTAIPEASYDLQMAFTSTFNAIERQSAGLAGNAYVATDLAAGTMYYWRVRAVVGGETSDWTTPFSFATAEDAVSLAAPELSSPADGAENIPVDGTSIDWNAVDGAATYSIQVSTVADFSTVTIQAVDLAAMTYALPTLEPATTYHWRAQASDGTVLSAWSVAFSFTTDAGATGLTPPVLSSPADGATGTTRDIDLQWGAVEGAVSYRIQVSTDNAFSALLFNQGGLTQTAYTVDNLGAGVTHYWRVRASNGGSNSAWSSIFSFTTEGSATLAPPVLTSPADGATGLDAAAITLGWAPASGATSYHIQVSTQPSFATQVVDEDGAAGTSLALPALNDATTYYWRVRSGDAGAYSDWSAAFDFATAASASLIPPILLTPANAANNQPLASVTLTWQTEPSAATYQVQVSTSAGFGTIAFQQSGLAATSYTVNNLVESTTYYWRVKSENAGESSDWSTVYSFSTAGGGSTNQRIALDLMGPNDTYYGLKGGLVDNGVPTVTATNGKIVIVAISMSNGLQEFDQFMALYEGRPEVSSQIELVNCAVAGSALENWLSEQTLWNKCKDNIEKKYTLDQVKVIWAKNADQFTAHGLTLPDPGADYYDLVNNIGALAQKIGDEFPGVQAIFNTSRIYGGYVVQEKQAARGEPISYEGGFATNAAIEKWKAGELPGAPWMGWGPYLWANGLTPNGSGIFWATSDFQGANGENQHPSEQGATKVADALHDFFMQFDWYRE